MPLVAFGCGGVRVKKVNILFNATLKIGCTIEGGKNEI